MRDEDLWRRLRRLGEGCAEPVPESIAAQRVAAVLIPLLADEPGCPVVFTQRSAHLRRHAGEICLPGGQLEPADRGSVIRAAVREAHEEIGLAPPHVSTCRVLSACHNSRGDVIYPVLAPVARPVRWQLQSEEVAGVIEVPLSHFLEAGHYRLERRRYDGQEKQSLVVTYGTQQIWGLTARIMHTLREQWLA
ncbi:NUDIX hydrolase [Stutzerimonas frequens]|uniref:NUDIX hydrolase n=1 Tax=Stutzerimonas frequens TaxID=2968969 RepID=UPI003F53BBE0